MKQVVWIPLAVLAGLILGSWGPRLEAKKLRVDNDALKKELKQKGGAQNTLGALTQMMHIPDADAAPAARPRPAVTNAPAATTNELPAATNAPPRPRRPREELRRDFRERIEQGMEAWRIRSDIARNNFLADAKFTPEQTAQFDVLMKAMNLRLKDRLTKFAEEVKSGQKVTPESGARVIHDLSGAVVLTYDEMDRTLPSTWRGSGPKPLDIADFIEPTVAEPLIGIEGEIEAAEAGRRR